MIDILLAVYNSSDFLTQTINSVLAQSFTDWQLLICDGGSTDKTVEIISEYVSLYPNKITFLSCSKSLSACENFSWLLEHSESEYIMFCDHDDVWLPHKIRVTFQAMEKAEQQYGSQIPLLVFTDMKVVDQKLKVLNDSNLKYQNLSPQNTALNRLLVQNVPSGCTMMMNRALVDLCKPIPPQAVMHDHWISLVAAAFGKIIFLNELTILYRQHENNYYGASSYNWWYFCCRYQEGLDMIKARFLQYIEQASAFYERYQNNLNANHQKMLYELNNWYNLSWIERRKVLLKHRVFKTGLRRNLGLFLIA